MVSGSTDIFSFWDIVTCLFVIFCLEASGLVAVNTFDFDNFTPVWVVLCL